MKIMRKRLLVCGSLVAAAGLLVSRYAFAEHVDINLVVKSPQGQAEASMDTTPPIGGVNPRKTVKAKAGDTIQVTWSMKSGFPHGTMKNMGVHFFVVSEEKLGQKPVPNPAGPAGIVDNSFVMDMGPKGKANGMIKFKIAEPGNYLVRLQSENTHDEHVHEHFSAIDLKVE